MLTNVQSLINEFTGYQVSAEQRSQLAGKGPRMKALAGEIKGLFPSLSAEDKGLFLAAVARGSFSIEKKTIWPMFLEAVGIEAPAPTPPAPGAAPAATNKVAGEILDHVKELVGMVSDLQKQIAELKKPATKRSLASV